MKYKLLLITLLVCGIGWGQTTDLIISEYVEGSSSNKYIEIYNGTGVTVDLSDYKLRLYTNGAASPQYDVNLSGTLNSGSVIVYKNSSADLNVPNAISNSAVNYNGDDAVVLYKISTNSNVDIFGVIGNDPGSAWTATGFSTKDKTLRRKSSICGGITVNPSGSGANAFITLSTEWDIFNTDDVIGLGSHTANCNAPTTTTWNGTTNTWSNGDPTSSIDAIIDGDLTTTGNLACKDLTINLGKTLTIAAGTTLTVSGNLVNNGSIIFKSDVTGSGQFDEFTGSITGNGTVQVERFIPARRAFRFLTSSVTTLGSIFENWQENSGAAASLGTHITGTGGATNGFDVTATNNPSMFGFNHNTGQWVAVTNTNVNTLTAGTPYRLMVRGDRNTILTTNTPTATLTTLRVTGSLKTGDFSPTLNQAAEGFSFIGNPYQAPIDMEAALTTSTNMNADVLYYWDPTINTRGGYVTRTLSANSNDVTSDFTEILQPGQAVFVKKDNTATAATMTISETHKNVAAGAAGVFRTSASNTQSNAIGLLRANLQASIDNEWRTTDAALALFDSSYTWDVTQEDASKMNNLDEEVSFVQNNTSLAIAKQNDASVTDELPIKLQQLRHTNYRWVFDLTNYNGNTPYLLDTEQNTLSVIEDGTVFPFTAGSNATNRFKIVFQNTTLTTDDFVKNIKLYPNPAKAGASFFVAGITEATVSVYNVVGQNIPVTVVSQGNAMQVTPTPTLSQGVYLVSVTTTDGKTAQVKWIVE